MSEPKGKMTNARYLVEKLKGGNWEIVGCNNWNKASDALKNCVGGKCPNEFTECDPGEGKYRVTILGKSEYYKRP
ncbi:MAG: hypothetical protein F4Z16_03670 [Rhodothermaceae bacterium]|nr:hypothetical protein [Rhodothermaceae bacterium]MYB90551.1 hypothetical protein [Rhodothermaceae bacterium]MYD68142.1 hypothetical protein [Rhodothermaceae bacterium]MYH12687.1 hypothetical protein [Rhodothermaceae bacterium]